MLNNKKDALYYSGPFSASQGVVVLNKGESYKIYGVNAADTITAAVTGTGTKPTATVSGNEITIEAGSTASTGEFTVTLTSDTKTTTIAVTVV